MFFRVGAFTAHRVRERRKVPPLNELHIGSGSQHRSRCFSGRNPRPTIVKSNYTGETF